MGAVNEIRQELDSYTNTNNLRDASLADTLTKQKNLVAGLLQVTGASLSIVAPELAEHEALNTANLAFGDFVAQAQLNYLKRTSNALLRYLRAMASTDGRQIVAQPSLTELFTGYQTLLSFLRSEGLIPIVEERTFTWVENPMPSDVASNVAQPSESSVVWPPTEDRVYKGMRVITSLVDCPRGKYVDSTDCADGQGKYAQFSCKCKSDIATIEASNQQFVKQLFYGPIPKSTVGIYVIRPQNTSLSAQYPRYVMRSPFVIESDSTQGVRVQQNLTRWYCVQFGAYKGLATFTSTPNMINGIPSSIAPLNDSECDALRLRSSTPGVHVYSLYVIKEGVIIPFYSNCTASDFITNNILSNVERIGYYTKYPEGYYYGENASYTFDTDGVYWSLGTGSLPPTPPLSDAAVFDSTDMFEYNMISQNCAINLSPEWIGGEYFTDRPPKTIPDIPTGFKFNQFTINPMGEISSSLEFVYTTNWTQTYIIQRVSDNSMITDEVASLEGSPVLFMVNQKDLTVIDESNYFFGEGNNGRDCIRKSANYSYDLTTCLYQNDLLKVNADNYFLGLIKTSGISRYVDKYTFSFTTANVGGVDQYSFTLIPKDDADFRFYIDSDGSVCPKLLKKEATTSSCTFTFSYFGTDKVTFANNAVTFTNKQAQVTTPLGLHHLTIGTGIDCMIVNCRYSLQQSVVELEPPKYDLIQATDLALETKIYYTFDKTVNGTLNRLDGAVTETQKIAEENKSLQDQLQTLNFSVHLTYKYENFSEMRKQVDEIINNISPKDPQGLSLDECGLGVFGSITCFFSNMASTIVTILIIVAVFAGIYIVCFKMGVAKNLTKKVMGK